MAAEDNKALIRRYYQALNDKDFHMYDEMIAPDVTYNGAAPGRDGMRHFSTTLRVAFPDPRVTVEDMVAEGDLVATFFTWTGTHLAELKTAVMGRVAPTGRSFTAKGMDLYRIRGEQIVEIRDSVDRLDLYRQLGVLAAPR
jgi:predicted ester cyclase